jgi:hypothetical protein
MSKFNLIILIAFICLLITACEDKCVLPKPYVSGDPVLIQKLLTESVDTLSYGENGRYFLDAYCWRDFMPTTDECDYRGLVSSISVKDTAGKQIPTEITVVKHYVLYKDSVWIANVSYKQEQQRGAYIINQGPLWPVDSLVDVIAEVKINSLKKYLIRKNVIIRAAY